MSSTQRRDRDEAAAGGAGAVDLDDALGFLLELPRYDHPFTEPAPDLGPLLKELDGDPGD